MYKIYVLLIAALAVWNFGIPELRAQNPEWIIYPDIQTITDIAQEDDFLWVTSTGGVTKLNRHTLESTLLTTANSGLPDHNVWTVAIQPNGKKWFGTQSYGLMLLDNDEWTVFTSENSPVRVPYPVVQGNNVWLRGNSDTLIHYDGQNWEIVDMSHVAEGADRIGFPYGTNSSLWVGISSLSGGTNAVGTAVYRLSDGKWSSIPLPSGMNITNISPVAHRNGVLWFNASQRTDKKTENVLMQYDGTWTTLSMEDIGFAVKAYLLMIDSTGRLWLPTVENVIVQYDGTTWQTLDLANTPLDSANITSMFTDSDGIIWAGTETRGLFRYENNLWSPVKLTSIEFPPYIPSFSIYAGDWLSSIVVDTDQSLWLNYGTNIETHVNGDTGRIEPLPFGGMYDQQFTAMDQKGNRWVASAFGLWRRYNSSWEKVSDERFSSLYIDRSNSLWLGTDNGVARYNNDLWTYYTIENSDFYSKCVAVTEDKNSTLWAATGDKLLTFDGNTWTEFDTQYPPELFGETPRVVKSMIADSTGLLWMIPDYEQKLFTFDGTTWTKYDTENAALAPGYCATMLTDRVGNIWIGAYDEMNSMGIGGGNRLIRVDYATKEWTTFTHENSPLPYELITCLAIDTSNNLWIGMAAPHKLVGYSEGGVLVDVDEQSHVQIQTIDLRSFPNPTNSQTTLRYSVPASAGSVPVRIQLFNTLGMHVTTLEESRKNPGEYSLDVDVTTLATGTYYYRLQIGNSVQTQQLVVAR